MVYLVCPGSERSGLTSANTASDLATILQRDILSRQACSCAAMVPSMPAGAVAVTTTFRSWEATGVLVQMEKLAQCRGRTRPGPTPVRFATALRSSTGRWSRLVVCAVCSRVSSPVFLVSPPLLSLSFLLRSRFRCWDMYCCRGCLQVTSSWWLLPLVQVWSCSSFSTVSCLLRVCACGGQRAMVNCCGWCELHGVVVAV